MTQTAYVILHYNHPDDTVRCVRSVKEKHGEGLTNVILVDNCSPDNTGGKLAEEYSEDREVTVICNEKNLGFANGLNRGISYLRDNGFEGFVVLLNNDTVLSSDGWDAVINRKYEEHQFGVLGPDIVSPDGKNYYSPMRRQDTSPEALKAVLSRQRKEYWLRCFHVWLLWSGMKTTLKGWTKARETVLPDKVPAEKLKCDMAGVQLQGSCLILSPLYFESFSGLYDKTFLYFEEAILRARCESAGLKCVYTPELRLIHTGGIITNPATKNLRKNRLYYLKQNMKSVRAFYEDIT